MKKYITPEIEWMLLAEDIVTASGGDNVSGDDFDPENPPPFGNN